MENETKISFMPAKYLTIKIIPCQWPNESESAYEVKNNCCLIERLFKVKKNGVFLFGISFFIFEIFTFSCYANEESDDVIGGSI